MSQIIAKKGFVYYLVHKKWRIKDFLEPLLILPLGFVLLKIIQDGFAPENIIIALAGIAYLTILFRYYRK